MDLREPAKTIVAIDKKLESKTKGKRDYMGISSLGGACDRALWFGFRWVGSEQTTGRMLRLFDRGAREEAEVVKHLKSVGVIVSEYGTHQREVSIGPWVKGHCDGIIERGLLESPNNPHILEIKTSNAKAFKELQAKGVAIAKPMHFAQMQLYMYATGIERAFYWCVCKDDDQVYTERIHLDENFAKTLADKGNALAMSNVMPPASGTAFSYQCKYCPFYGVCFGTQEPEKNCRTCKYGQFGSDGLFHCCRKRQAFGKSKQMKACTQYVQLEVFKKNPWEK